MTHSSPWLLPPVQAVRGVSDPRVSLFVQGKARNLELIRSTYIARPAEMIIDAWAITRDKR